MKANVVREPTLVPPILLLDPIETKQASSDFGLSWNMSLRGLGSRISGKHRDLKGVSSSCASRASRR